MKRPVSLLLRVALAAAAVGFLVALVDPAEIAAAARAADPAWIAAAAALLPLNFALQGLVWYTLVRRVMPAVRFGSTFAALLSGHTLGVVTPAHAGDLVGRAFYLPHADKWELSAAVLVHRMIEMVAVMDVGVVALAYYLRAHAPTPAPFWQGLAACGAVLAAGLTVLALAPRLTHRLLHRLLRRPHRQRRVAFLGRLSAGRAAALLGACFAAYGVFTTQFFLLLKAFVPGADPLDGYVGIALVYFVKFIVPAVTFLDVGIREGAAVYFLGSVGFDRAAAFNAAFLLFCLNLLVPAAAGLPLLLRLRIGRRAGEPVSRGSAAAPSSRSLPS